MQIVYNFPLKSRIWHNQWNYYHFNNRQSLQLFVISTIVFKLIYILPLVCSSLDDSSTATKTNGKAILGETNTTERDELFEYLNRTTSKLDSLHSSLKLRQIGLVIVMITVMHLHWTSNHYTKSVVYIYKRICIISIHRE